MLFFMLTASPIFATQTEIVSIQDAQQFQHEFDEQYWQINEGFEKLRHILLHLVKTSAKMANFCDIKEHGKVEPDPAQLINEVLPDLFLHALQIANFYDIDLGEKYIERMKFLIQRSIANQSSTTH